MNKFTFGKVAIATGIMTTCFSGQIEAQKTRNWSQAGPVYAAGRVRNLIVDKNNGNLLYVGSTSSGIFKSENGGAVWAPVNDQDSVRNISYIAQDKNGEIYAGTGEGFLRYSQKGRTLPGIGLYKLNGGSLQLVAPASMVGQVINRVACSPVNENIIVLTTEKGVMISKDKGASFSNAAGIPTSSLISGMDAKFDKNGILYCSAGDHRGHAGNPSYVNVWSKVYKSSDANLSGFSDITPVVTTFSANYGRIELAVSQSDPNTIYASCANKNTQPASAQSTGGNSASLKGLFVSYNAGASWALILQGSPQLDPLSNGATVASGDYAHVLAVHPENKNMLFVGGFAAYIFQRNGGTDQNPLGAWFQIGQSFFDESPSYLRHNIHDFKMVTGQPNKYYIVTDAGIYRSIDELQSYQPFYKGMVTGQFNSVSIEQWPLTSGGIPSTPGAEVVPHRGFIGGTSGSGLTYFSGTADMVAAEESTGGEVYNAEYSKILSDAAIFTDGSGDLNRISNVKNSDPAVVKMNAYTGPVYQMTLAQTDFVNNAPLPTGTPFSLWENWGQNRPTPDSVLFYNDTLRAQASLTGSSAAVSAINMSTTASFELIAPRPSRSARIDSIVIRTGTVMLQSNGAVLPGTYPNRKVVTLKLRNAAPAPSTYTAIVSTPTGTLAEVRTVALYTGTNLTVSGPVSTVSPRVEYLLSKFPASDAQRIDNIQISFDEPPFKSQPTGSTASTPDVSAFYRVFATVYYKYNKGDTVYVVDNSISNKTFTYSTVLADSLRWKYGTPPATTFSIAQHPALTNPTFVMNPGNVNNGSSTTFTVNILGQKAYTVSQYGDYRITVPKVIYTLTVQPDTIMTTAANGGYTFGISPGSATRTTTTRKATVTFTVNADTTSTFTITQGNNTTTAVSFSTIIGTTYSLEPGAVSQNTNVFNVNVPTGSATTFSIWGIPSSTMGALTSTTHALPVNTQAVGGTSLIPFATKTNPLVKIPTIRSARLAVSTSNAGLTNGAVAVLVSKNPLALNDPLNFVRVSQSGARTDNSSGDPTTGTITVDGTPTLLKWSTVGTELYYATDANKLYRVSHIDRIYDMATYSGKFTTELFAYNPTAPGTAINPTSPYRTTLIGTFDKPITSIAVTSDDKHLLVTLAGTSTGTTSTTGNIFYNSSADIRKCDASNSGFVNKVSASAILSKVPTYSSIFEMRDNKEAFVGTDRGVYHTADINATPASWQNVNDMAGVTGKLPRVQVYDIEQQVRDHWDSYNSGEIYVATYGRGVWSNNFYLIPYAVGIDEESPVTTFENGLSIYPNPTNGEVNIRFNSASGEKSTIRIFDLSGRNVRTEHLEETITGENTYRMGTQDLGSGIYLISIDSDVGERRIGKLIVTK
jgi:hypothetical protein